MLNAKGLTPNAKYNSDISLVRLPLPVISAFTLRYAFLPLGLPPAAYRLQLKACGL
jgi:hypothetical protein